MATKYFALLTNVGAAKLANATALGAKIEITQMAVGDGNGTLPTPNPAQTALAHELRRAQLNTLTIDPANTNQIIAEQVIPEDVGGWWIREIGLFDKDGDMIAVANCAETYKPKLQEGSGRVQVIRVILIVSSADAVTLKIDPSVVLATREYVDGELKKHAESRNHPDGTLTAKGFVQLSSATTSADETKAATPKAVKDVNDASVKKADNLSDLKDKAAARKNLALGTAATKDVGTGSGNVMEMGTAGLGVGPVPKANAYSNIAQFYRVDDKASNKPPIQYTSAGVVCLPIDGAPTAGYLAVSGRGECWVGRSGTAALGVTWNRLYAENYKPSAADVEALDRADFPVGIPQPWPTATAPDGWLKCNGSTFDKVKYPLLAAAYPNGKLPDLRGEFIRGLDDGRGVDPNRTLLSPQADAVQKFTGKTNGIQHFVPGLTTEGIVKQGEAIASTTGLTETGGSAGNGVFRVELDASRQIRTATETRPRNMAFNYIVRAA
ncbi:phage tail protein [Serratia ureilytica]|uniref:phage tail-collar fiber domain-containing protein n=1 Tax=Serratia ureilytica TaxID=300181 RepID=UPI0037156308